VTLEIANNWYWFLVFSGGILAIAMVVLFIEKRSDNDEILKIKPLVVLRNILLIQIGFCAIYLLVTFSVDITVREPFSVYQVFSAVEFSFNTYRGLFTGLSFILGLAFTSIVLTAVVQTYKNMLDYCFTLFVIHFIVVSIVLGDFPTLGAWWTAGGIGLLLSMIFTERLSYHLETMSYQSHLSGPEYKSKKPRLQQVDLPQVVPETKSLMASIDIKVDEVPERISSKGESTQELVQHIMKESNSQKEKKHSHREEGKSVEMEEVKKEETTVEKSTKVD